MSEEIENNPKPKVDNSQFEQKMKALAEQLAKNSEFVENNLIVIQKTGTKNDDLPDINHKTFLKLLYGQMRFKKDFAFASLMKGLLIQNRLFFTFTKESLPKMVDNDPDNINKGLSFDMKPFCALLAQNGICHLWDAVVSTKKTEQRVAGYVMVNPAIRDLLKVDKVMALEQFRELKKLSGNEWVTEEMVFDSCGELRVSIDDHRVLVEGRRTKSSESRSMNDDDGVTTEELTFENFDLSKFFTEDAVSLLQKIVGDSDYSRELFMQLFFKAMAPSFKNFLKNKSQITEKELSEKVSSELKKAGISVGYFKVAIQRAFIDCAKQSGSIKIE